MSELVLTHSPCTDGYTSKWCASKFLPDAEFIDAIYGEPEVPLAQVEGKDVFLIDFCYPRAYLQQIISVAQTVTILDHHKTAKENLEGLSADNLTVIFDMSRSGCQIAWDFFSAHTSNEKLIEQLTFKDIKTWKNNKPRPPLIDYVGDRDLWNWKLENSREISEAISSYDQSLDTWDALNTKIEEFALIEEGKAILRATQKQVKSAMELAYERSYNGEKIMVVNCATNISDVGSELRDKTPVKMSVVWFQQPDNKYKISLRSTKDYDCSAVAKLLGGGGHHQAAGCIVEQLPEWMR